MFSSPFFPPFRSLHAEILPPGEECVPAHLRGLHELVDGHGHLELQALRRAVQRKGHVEVGVRREVGHALHVDHLLELRAGLHRRVHRLDLQHQRLLQLGRASHDRLEVLKKERGRERKSK